MLVQLSADAYPTGLLLATSAAHVALAFRLGDFEACADWSKWFALSVATAKAGTLAVPVLPAKALLPLGLFLLFATSTLLHPPKHKTLQVPGAAGLDWTSGCGIALVQCSGTFAALRPVLVPLLLPNSDASELRIMMLGLGLAASQGLHLVARHFPHRNRLRRLVLALAASAALVGWLDPYHGTDPYQGTASREGGVHLGLSGWALCLGGLLAVSASLRVVALDKIGPSGRAAFGATMAAALTLASLPTASLAPPVLALAVLHGACLGAAVALLALPSALPGSGLSGPIFCSALCAGAAAYALHQIAPFGDAFGHAFGDGGAKEALVAEAARESLWATAAASHLLTSAAVSAAVRHAEQADPKTPYGRRGVGFSDSGAAALVGNGGCVVGWGLAGAYVRRHRAANLASLMVELPMGLFLLLLRDDGGLLEGLGAHNRQGVT